MKETTPDDIRVCMQCSKPIKGRSDKKFCTAYCRTDYNNILQKKKTTDCLKNINEILLHNRTILKELSESKIYKTKEDQLIALGFHFHFHTHSIKKGNILKYYCYDIGYINNKGVVTILRYE
jgi:hypothetical protein